MLPLNILCTLSSRSSAHREIIMDISDVEGDSAAGIITLPVLL
ncbi:unnamed protein product, partial [Discosporangium mesarthrocarpum]